MELEESIFFDLPNCALQKWYAVIYFTGLTGTRNVIVAGGSKVIRFNQSKQRIGSENKFRFAVLNANSFK